MGQLCGLYCYSLSANNACNVNELLSSEQFPFGVPSCRNRSAKCKSTWHSLLVDLRPQLTRREQKPGLWRELCVCKIGPGETHEVQACDIPGIWSFPEAEIFLASEDRSQKRCLRVSE